MSNDRKSSSSKIDSFKSIESYDKLSKSDNNVIDKSNKDESIEELSILDDDEFFILKKINSFSKDYREKYPIIAILGIVSGLIFIIIAFVSLLGSSEKIADNISLKEDGMFSALILIVGLIIFWLSIFRLFAKKSVDSIFKSLDGFDSIKFNEENLSSKPKGNEDSDVPIIEEDIPSEVIETENKTKED